MLLCVQNISGATGSFYEFDEHALEAGEMKFEFEKRCGGVACISLEGLFYYHIFGSG